MRLPFLPLLLAAACASRGTGGTATAAAPSMASHPSASTPAIASPPEVTPTPSTAEDGASAPVAGDDAVAGCHPVLGPSTTDPAVAVACDGCLEKRNSGMGLPPGVSFGQCVERSTASVRDKLAKNPHLYDAVLAKIMKK